VELWNLTIRQEVLTLKGHTGQVGAIAFSSDGSTLATAGGSNATVRVWRAASFPETDALVTRPAR
jgi:WD40 repeat protein